MARFLVSFEVDDVECFDMIAKNRDLMGALGERLAEVCICPGSLHWSNRAGLSMYGIEKLTAERIDPTPRAAITPTPDTGTAEVAAPVPQPIRDEPNSNGGAS